MSCQVTPDGRATVVVLEAEMLIQHAAEFYRAVLPLAGSEGPVRIDGSASKSIHTSIMQILHALAQAVPDFAVTDASAEFRAAEIRVGFSVTKNQPIPTSDRPAERA